MKYIVLAVVLFCAWSFAEALDAKVTFIQGKSQINYAPVKLNQLVKEKDYIATTTGKLEITLSTGTIIRIGENTTVHFEKLVEVNGSRKVGLKVVLGKIWTKVKKLTGNDEYNVSFRTGTAGVRGTVYRVDQMQDNSADLFVYEGSVEVKGEKPQKKEPPKDGDVSEVNGPEEVSGPTEVSMEEWTQIVREMMEIHISPDGVPTEPEQFDPAEQKKADDWVKWNLEQDKKS